MKVDILNKLTNGLIREDDYKLGINIKGVCFGDSITQGGSKRGFYPTIAEVLLKGTCSFVNKGITGDWTADMLARFNNDVVALKPQFVIINGGKNDISNLVNITTICSNIVKMVKSALENGIEPILSSVIPYGASASATNDKKSNTTLLNQWIRFFCKSNGLRFIDFYKAIIDVETGFALADCISSDNIHPSPKGIYKIAQEVVNIFSNLPTGYDDTLIKSDLSNLILNPLFLTDSNSDGLADNWTLGNYGGGTTPIKSLIANEIEGNFQNITISGGNDNVIVSLLQQVPLTNIVAGDIIVAEADIKINSFEGGNLSMVNGKLSDTASNESFMFKLKYPVEGRGITTYTISEGQHILYIMFQIVGVTSIDISIGRVKIYKLPYPVTL